MNVYIIGTGVDGNKTLTAEAKNAIENSALLIGAERMISPYENSGKELFASYDADKITEKIMNSNYDNISVLMSGDCGFFSGAKKLLPMLKNIAGCSAEIIPGISSAAYLCAKTGLTYENMKFISLHGKRGNPVINVRMNEKCFFLLGNISPQNDICHKLCRSGMSDVKIYIGEDLGYENEKIISGTAGELKDYSPEEKLSVLIALNENYLKYIPAGISDDEFIRAEKIPMTKSEVRCLAVSALNICHDSVCWDIGSGSGSVSVEMAFRCPDGMVVFFEKNDAAFRLTAGNLIKFGCDNFLPGFGKFPDEYDLSDKPSQNKFGGYPKPDKVFIGGSSGNMCEIFECIHEKNKFADICVTAVSLETLNETVGLFEKYCGNYSVTQTAAARTKKIGGHTMLNAQNPVFIIKGRLA